MRLRRAMPEMPEMPESGKPGNSGGNGRPCRKCRKTLLRVSGSGIDRANLARIDELLMRMQVEPLDTLPVLPDDRPPTQVERVSVHAPLKPTGKCRKDMGGARC